MCRNQKIAAGTYDSIINKTPLSARTNRILGKIALSAYLSRLEKGAEGATPIEAMRLDDLVRSHLIDPALLRSDAFEAFFAARRESLLGLIEAAMGQSAYRGDQTNEPEGEAPEEEEVAPFADAAE